MNEGDTLVFINYPGDRNAYDASGFPLKKTHRVHSDRLLATESKVFAKLLGEWEQHKARRRRKYLHHLPAGVKFILDLTPPEEGEEALDLTADLSCSPGILRWKETALMCGVPYHVVGGKDEVMISRIQGPSDELPSIFPKNGCSLVDPGNATAIPPDLPAPPKRHGSFSSKKTPITDTSNLSSILHDASATIRAKMESQHESQSSSKGASSLQPISTPSIKTTGNPIEVPIDSNPTNWAHNMRDRTAEQTSDLAWPNEKNDNLKGQLDGEDNLLDYCPIRHRAGIERLLQVIEGKSPRLDSAPKVWTVVMLAKYFDCTSAVVSLYPIFPTI